MRNHNWRMGWVVLALAFPLRVDAASFWDSYDEVIECRSYAKRAQSHLDARGWDIQHYVFIQTENNGKFIVNYDRYQYPSFSRTQYHQTYIGNGGEAWASLTLNKPFREYRLFFKRTNGELDVTLVRINFQSMTFATYYVDNHYSKPPIVEGVCARVTEGFNPFDE